MFTWIIMAALFSIFAHTIHKNYCTPTITCAMPLTYMYTTHRKRYYMERKIFQHLLELKSLQIRSSKINESVLVKRAVDDYHKSTLAVSGMESAATAVTGGGGGSLRRYPYKDYTFKNFEIFLYETLKSLQKTGTHNFQNISDVYKEVRAWNLIFLTYCMLLAWARCTAHTYYIQFFFFYLHYAVFFYSVYSHTHIACRATQYMYLNFSVFTFLFHTSSTTYIYCCFFFFCFAHRKPFTTTLFWNWNFCWFFFLLLRGW